MSKAIDNVLPAGADTPPPACLGVGLKYPLRENHVVATTLFRGLFDAFDYTGAAHRLEVPSRQPLQLVEYGRGSVTVHQTMGFRLNQRNGDILLALVQRALNHGFAESERILVKVSADELLAAIGKECRQYNRVWLETELGHMKRSSFKVSAPGLLAWEFSLISDLVSDASKRGLKAPSHYEIELNARLTQVFVQCGWSIVKGSVLVELLEHDPFTRALYLFYCTYPKLPWIHESELKRIFHRESMERNKWLAMLRKGLETIRAITGWHQLEMLGKAMRKGDKLLPRGQVIAVELAPKTKQTVARKSRRGMANGLDCVWHMASTSEELQALGKSAFIASGKYDSALTRVGLSSSEESEFEAKLAELGRLSNRQKMTLLYDFLIETRAAWADDASGI